MVNGLVSPSLIIERKRDGLELTRDEIKAFVSGYTVGRIADSQMAALAMAVYLRGMSFCETRWLTEAMLDSGRRLEWSGDRPVVDKHSTGGVGDNVSLVLVPLLACCGVRVPMISGRGLGLTGGTLDKLESIPGFRTELSLPEIQRLTDQVGCVITGATKELVPADRKLYALRDVTGTVGSVPLITASILSKKLAEGLDTLVLDVKCGRGAFMKTLDEAKTLTRSLVAVGGCTGVRTVALVTDMTQPLGRCVGNAIEVEEAIRTLQGRGPHDLWEVVSALGTELLVSAGLYRHRGDANLALIDARDSGRAIEKFRQMVTAQGGDLSQGLPKAPAYDVRADRSGFVRSIDAERIGRIVSEMGAGRQSVGAPVDHSVGVEFLVQGGETVRAGDLLARVLSPPARAEAFRRAVAASVSVSDEPVDVSSRVMDRVVEEHVRDASVEPTSPRGDGSAGAPDAREQIQRLIAAARAAREHAYAPYSGYRVGAAALASDGALFTGSNVENASYGLTLCAERVAVAKAVAAGHRPLEAVAIVAEGKAAPCGACRQFLAEFGENLRVYAVGVEDESPVRCWKLSDLLPHSFRLE